MSNSIGTARVDIVMDTAQYELAIARAKNAAVGFGTDAEAAFAKQTHGSKNAARSLLTYVNALGKTKDEVRLLRAAGAGVDKAIIDAATKAMNEYATATAAAAADAAKLSAALAADAELNKQAAVLERQIATYGMTTAEMRRMDAASTDLTGRLSGLVEVLERVEAVTARDNAIASMTAQLEKQMATLGMSTAELRQYSAAAAGISAEVQPLLDRLQQMESAFAFQGKLDSATAALEKQIATFGMSEAELRRYELAAQGVGAEVEQLVSSLERMEAKAKQDGAVEQMTAALRRQIETLGMNAAELRAYEASLAGVSNEVQPLLLRLEQLEGAMAFQGKLDSATAALERQIATFGMGDAELRRYQLGLDGVVDSVEPLLLKLEALEAEAKMVQQALNDNAQVNSFIGGLEAQATAIGKTNSELLEMKAAKMGVSQQAAPFIQMLRAEEERVNALRGAMDRGGKQLNAYGLSQKQLDFAMRGVPAQITDIFVSLQGGQAPLTVLLQQGGQLKDMFGGIKPAASALAGEMLKLINVYTVVAAAVGVAAIAWYKASKEQESYHKALIMTGFYSAQTADQLDDMANRMDAVAGVTRGAAAAAITEMAKVGSFTAEQMELAAEASLRMSNVMGVELDKTKDKFVALGKDPVKALLDLNAAEHFLTQAQLDRVRALIEEGNNQAAVTEAFRIYADTIENRTGAVIEQVNGISNAWRNLKQGMAEGWDAITGVMGQVDEKFAALSERVQKMNGVQRFGVGLATSFIGTPALTAAMGLAGNKPDALPRNLDTPPTVDSKAVNEQEENNKKWTQLQSRYLTDLQRQTNEEKEIRALGEKLKLDSVQVEAQVAAMHEKYRDKSTRGGDKSERDSLRADLQAYKDQAEITTAAIEANARVTQQAFQTQQISAEDYYNAMRQYSQQELEANTASIMGQLQVLQTAKDTSNARRQAGELEAQLAAMRSKHAADQQVRDMQETESVRKRVMEITRFTENMERSNQQYAESLQLQASSVAMGSMEAQRLGEIVRLYSEQAQKLSELNQLRRENPGDALVYDQQEAVIRKSTSDRVKLTNEGFTAMDAMTSNWINGYRRAFDNYSAEMRDVASQAEGWINGISGNITSVVQDLVVNGKASTTDLVNYMSKELARLGTQKILTWLMGMWGGNTFTVQRETIPLYENAKGGVYNSPDLSKYSGQVHDSPQFFKFAKGGGVFGEAGPEAIMPLKRGSNGKLGVVAQGGGGNNVTVNLIGAPADTQVNERQEADGSFTLDVIFGQVEGYLAGNVSSGTGSLNAAMRGRYGLKEQV